MLIRKALTRFLPTCQMLHLSDPRRSLQPTSQDGRYAEFAIAKSQAQVVLGPALNSFWVEIDRR